jgi:hypothetical protein
MRSNIDGKRILREVHYGLLGTRETDARVCLSVKRMHGISMRILKDYSRGSYL